MSTADFDVFNAVIDLSPADFAQIFEEPTVPCEFAEEGDTTGCVHQATWMMTYKLPCGRYTMPLCDEHKETFYRQRESRNKILSCYNGHSASLSKAILDFDRIY